MDFKKLNQQRVTKTTTSSPASQTQLRGMTQYQIKVINKSIDELHEKIVDAQETAARLEREMPKARRELEVAQANVEKAATSYTRGRLNRAREKMSEKELAIKGTEVSVRAWEEQMAQKRKVLADDRRLNGERSAFGTPVPEQRTVSEVTFAPAVKKAPMKITRRTVKVPLGPSMKQMAEKQAAEIVRRRIVRERELQEKREAAALEKAAEKSAQQCETETPSREQAPEVPEGTPSCGKRKRTEDAGSASKKTRVSSESSGSSQLSDRSETSQHVKTMSPAYDSTTAEAMKAKGKYFVYHPKQRTLNWHSIGQDDQIVGLAQLRRPSSSRSDTGSAAAAMDSEAPRREREGEDDYQLHGLVNTKLSCFSNGTLQMLGAALSYEQIKQLRGDGDLSTFGLKHDDFLMLKTDADGKMKKADKDNLDLLRSRISIYAAKNGEIPIAPYLGQLLIDIREGISHKSKMPKNKYVAGACLMQQVFAYGAEGRVRSLYDGDSQQDARLYLGALIDAVGEEHNFLPKMFERVALVELECSECLHKSEHRETDVILDASLPEKETADDEVSVRDLPELRQVSTERLAGHKCEECGETEVTSKKTTIVKLPDYLLLHLKRARADDKKAKTKVDLSNNTEKVQLGEDQFAFRCVLRHTGRSSSRGHYDVVREHSGKWYVIDDQIIAVAKVADFEDSGRRQSAMVLLRKVKE